MLPLTKRSPRPPSSPRNITMGLQATMCSSIAWASRSACSRSPSRTAARFSSRPSSPSTSPPGMAGDSGCPPASRLALPWRWAARRVTPEVNSSTAATPPATPSSTLRATAPRVRARLWRAWAWRSASTCCSRSCMAWRSAVATSEVTLFWSSSSARLCGGWPAWTLATSAARMVARSWVSALTRSIRAA